MSKKSKLIIKDPLYKVVFIEPNHINIIDSEYFQRLRHVKQTTFVDLVYPSANHTRFSHSIGVYNLMKKVLNNSLNEVSKKDKEHLLKAALLHDIGHGPFSHFWETIFPHFNHETATREILKKYGFKEEIKILEGNHPLYYLISSSIDVDKLDYMARDSYFAGVSYGLNEVDFIIEHMYVKNNKLLIKPSSLSSVEDLITQRVNLFKTVYFHKFSLYYEYLAKMMFKRVKYLFENNLLEKTNTYVDKNILSFYEKNNTIDNLLKLNDFVVMNNIYMWINSSDKILSNFAYNFIYRKKEFKIINLDFEKININNIKKLIKEKYKDNWEYYFYEIENKIKIVQTDIYVDFGQKIEKIEKVSKLINFYKKLNWKVKFVIFPKEFY
jgi:hypothetical protein